ncbi:MAG: oligosaccharide flippase family protein [Clostridia bacterium]|nr:oligosaccharide flippase family protein [Clostridia bacterium]
MKTGKVSSIAKNSILLTIVKCVTMVTGIIQIMLLSRIMTLFEYGMYSQLLIVVSIATIFASLGLNNAVNYFYNKEENAEEKSKYINTIFILTTIIGIIAAIVIFVLKVPISNYYDNKSLIGLLVYIVLRPLFQNLISIYQSLYISVGRAKTIAARNFIISVLQAISIPLSFWIFESLKAVLVVQLVLDVLQIIYFGFDFNKKVMKISINKMDLNVVKSILKYAIPLGLALMLGTLFKESDKLVIAKLMDEESLAIYTNMSKQLPFEFIALSFTAVITPVIIRCWSKNDMLALKKLWGNYFQFGYISTWILCAGAIVCAPEVLRLLFSDKYIIGLDIFIIYLFIEMFRFCYFGIILSATGKTRVILYSSMIALISNIVLNVILYKFVGFSGPAWASLMSVIAINLTQLIVSCRLIKINLREIVNYKRMLKIIITIVLSGMICLIFKKVLYGFINNYVIVLIIIYGMFVLINLFISKYDIKETLKNMREE